MKKKYNSTIPIKQWGKKKYRKKRIKIFEFVYILLLSFFERIIRKKWRIE